MPEPEIPSPEVPWGPLLTAGVAAAGSSLLFPAMAVPVVGAVAATGIGVLAFAIIGGIAGWYTGKALFTSTLKTARGEDMKAPQAAFPPDREPDLSISAYKEKEWRKSEGIHRRSPPAKGR